MFFARRSSLSRSMARSLSAFTASFTFTWRIRWVPPFRSSPRLMRLRTACFNALPPSPLGMPKMPKRNTSITATIKTVFQSNVLFIGILAHGSRLMASGAAFATRPGPCALRLRLSFFRSHHGDHRALRKLQPQVIGRDAQMERGVAQGDDCARDSALGNNAVSRLQLIDHLLPLLLPLL